MVGHLPCLSNCLVWWKCMVLEQMLEVWLVILDMKASQHAAFKQRFSAHNRSAVAVQTLPLIVLTSDPSSYDIGTVCSTVWKIIALLQFLWAHLKRSHLSGRLRPWLCFFAVRKIMFMFMVGSSWQTEKHLPRSCRFWLAVPCWCILMYYSGPSVENIDMFLLINAYFQNWSTN